MNLFAGRIRSCIPFLAVLLAAAAQAQTDWPARPIRVLYPFAAGGVGDTSFRMFAAAVEAKLGQRFVIEARPGAAGNIGALEAARAAPDGYTLMIAPTSVYAVNPHLFKNLGYDPLVSYEPITVYADAPLVALASTGVPAATLKELADFARANPGKLNFASPGVGSPSHLTGELFSQMTGRSMVHVPFKGTPPMVQAIIANDVQFMVATLGGNVVHIKSGRMKALAVTARARMPEIPDVPTTVEAGFPELLASNWWGLGAPRGTDRRIVERLAAEVHAALADPATRKRIAELGMIPVGGTPAEFASLMRSESARWKAVIEHGGIKAE